MDCVLPIPTENAKWRVNLVATVLRKQNKNGLLQSSN